MAERTERSAATGSSPDPTRPVAKPRDPAKVASEAPPVDVDALVASVKARLDASAVSGEGAGEARPAVKLEVPLPDEALARSFELLKRAGPLDPRVPIQSHRAVVGPVVVLLKSVLRRALQPAFSALFDHQSRFDQASLAYAEELYKRIVGMESDLRTRLERIEARHAMELETIERRLGRLERLVDGASPDSSA